MLKTISLKKSIGVDLWASRIGFGLIFGYCLLASIYVYYFAQKHLTLSFLPFPIFVGEIVMFICVPLLLWVCKDGRLLKPRARLLLGIYFTWVFLRALINYHEDGPLAFRNAALFYYPVFAVFAYCFYQKAAIPRNVWMLLAFLAGGITLFKVMNVWYWWTYVCLLVIAVRETKSIQWRRFGGIFLAVLFLLEKDYFYKGPRAHFVSVFFSLFFLVLYFGAFFIRRHDYLRLSVVLAGLLIFISGYAVFSEHNSLSSLTSLKRTINNYHAFDRRLQQEQANYVPEKFAPRLYNHKDFSLDIPGNIFQSHIREERPIEIDENDIVFRLFIWRDMARELIQKRAWWGFSFGHPQRSRSLEALNWARTEWSRDGWITPHNSFFHIIYRAGILGVFFIGVLFFMFYRLITDFSVLNSVEGGLLAAAMVYWLVLSNFFVILEFPYNAILFWSLFGIALAYRDGLKAAVI